MDEGRVAVITGAGSGIGREVAIQLASRGYSLTLAGRRKEPLEATATMCRQRGVAATTIAADVGLKDSAAAIVEHTISEHGHLSALVNNAGTATLGTLVSISDQDTTRMFEVNVLGPLRLIKAATPFMEREPSASIVNVTSAAAIRPTADGAAYGASKAALTLATRCLAQELGPRIRVNAVLPGVCRTEMWGETGWSAEEVETRISQLGAIVPTGRVGEPAEVAKWVCELLDPSSGWVTGSTFSIDGGLAAM
jgi:NAD(P)-dependent dehydrogenase (short-subunit alcohol dehydrogenase family)